MHVAVTCRSGANGAPVPATVRIGGRSMEIADILDIWPGAEHTYYKVRAATGALYILRHDHGPQAPPDDWQLTMYARRRQSL